MDSVHVDTANKIEQERQQKTIACNNLQPAFTENNIAILCAANEQYMPYFSTILQSIIQKSSKKYNYDIIMFYSEILLDTQQKIIQQCKPYTNISIRFFNVTPIMQPYMHLALKGHITIETYYRLLSPYILTAYSKILYLDCDMLVQADVAKLYNTELDSRYLLAACRDIDMIGCYHGAYDKRKKYVDEVLQLKNPDNYFQAGVILFNLQAFREKFSIDYIMEFSASEEWELMDQRYFKRIGR